MRAQFTTLVAFAGVACLLATPPGATAQDKNPARIAPLSEKTLNFKEGMSDIAWYMPMEDDDFALLVQFVLSPDGKTLFLSDMGGKVTMHDTATGKRLGRFGSGRIQNLALAPDGKTIAAMGGSMNYGPFGPSISIDLWDLAKGKPIKRLDEGANRMTFTAVAFSPDGKTLALGAASAQGYFDGPVAVPGPGGGPPGKEDPPPGGDRKQRDFAIHLWDAVTGDELRQIDGPTRTAPKVEDNPWVYRGMTGLYEALSFTPDGRTLAMIADNRILLWEMATGRERSFITELSSPPRQRTDYYFGGTRSEFCLAVAPDGRTLAVGGRDGVIRHWDIPTGRELPPLAGHKGPIRSIRYAPDGKSLWSVGWDTKFVTWPAGEAVRKWQPSRDKLSDQALAGLWKDLGQEDAVLRYVAVQQLAAAADQALAFLGKQVKPVQAGDAAKLTKLAETLSMNQDYNERKKAAVELRKIGEPAMGVLRGNPGGAKNGFGPGGPGGGGMGNQTVIEMIEQDLHASAEHRQKLASVRALELIGNDEAAKLLGELAGGLAEAQLTREAKAAKERLATIKTPKLEMDALWTDLAGEDSKKAFLAIRLLSANPDKSLPFLREQLNKLSAKQDFEDDPQRIAKLIDDLDSNTFKTRESATKELAKLGPLAAPALRKALEKATSAEAKKRLEDLLKASSTAPPLTEKLRAGRAFETLELIASAEARKALEGLSKDSKNAWFKETAADALQRMGK